MKKFFTKLIGRIFKPCQCVSCRYDRGESIDTKEALKNEAEMLVKKAKKDAKLLRGLFS